MNLSYQLGLFRLCITHTHAHLYTPNQNALIKKNLLTHITKQKKKKEEEEDRETVSSIQLKLKGYTKIQIFFFGGLPASEYWFFANTRFCMW